jgi:nucleolar MIF4G domain-containing protein 1
VAAYKPRMPAMVKREVAENGEEALEEDAKRMEYRGFDKSKLNASRKQQRKEARMMKKKGRAEKQKERSMENERLKKLKAENLRLRRILDAQQSQPAGHKDAVKNASDRKNDKRKAGLELEAAGKRPKIAQEPAKQSLKGRVVATGAAMHGDEVDEESQDSDGDEEDGDEDGSMDEDMGSSDGEQRSREGSGAQVEAETSEDDEDEDDEDDEEDGEESEESADSTADRDSGVKGKESLEANRLAKEEPEGGVAKYVPPHLRAQMLGAQSADAKLQAAVRNRLNKVSEGNLTSMVGEMERLYSSNPRSSVDHQLAEIILELSGEGAGRIIGQFAALYAALVAALHASVGTAVGARFLERLVRELDVLVQEDEPGARGINLSLIFANLYVFKVIDCSLVYAFVRLLTERFSDGSLDMLLALLRTSGAALRADDPAALREIIQLVRTRAGAGGASDSLSGRGRFVLDFIYDLQNNRLKKGAGGTGIAAVAAEEAARLGKWLRDYCKKPNGDALLLQLLRPNWQDLVVVEKAGGRMGAGQWWEQGIKLEPVRMKHSGAKGLQAHAEEEVVGGERAAKLNKLAGAHKMGSDVRKAIFMVMMDSEDYLDATEKLLRMKLPDAQAREIVRVAFHCCCHEGGWNPFYAHLLTHLCSVDRHHQLTLRLCFWDAFKAVDVWADSASGRRKIGNLAQLLAHAWVSSALSLSLLKPIEIEKLGEGGSFCMRLAFRALLLQGGDQTLAKLVGKIAGGDRDMAELRAGIRWFFHKFMGGKAEKSAGVGEGEGELPTGEVKKESRDKKELLAERVQAFIGLLAKCCN